MPTYEYLCPAGHHFDLIQKMADKPKARCPQCGKQASRQISGGAGLVFKGSGFYITDYRSEGYKAAAKKDSDSAKPAAASSDTKPAAAKPADSAKPKPAAGGGGKSSE